jgi:hypothetical protein
MRGRGSDFVSPAELARRRAAGDIGYDDVVVLLRTTLMDPFTLEAARGDKDYIALFPEMLLPLLRKVRRILEISTPLRVPADLERLAEIRRFVRERATAFVLDPDLLPRSAPGRGQSGHQHHRPWLSGPCGVCRDRGGARRRRPGDTPARLDPAF